MKSLFKIAVAVAAIGSVFALSNGAVAKENTLTIPVDARYAPLDKAQFTFAITNVTYKGNQIFFTIPQNARSIDNQANAVTVSGMYIDGRDHTKDCPVVTSDKVSQSTNNYNPFSGQATITSTFDDATIAQEAYDHACILIIDLD